MPGQRRDLPRCLRVATQVQHIVVMGVAAHPHRHQLDERGPEAGARPLGGPTKGARNRLGIRPVDRDAGHAVARRLLGERTDGRLIRHRRRQRGLIVLDAEDRRQAPHGAQVDRLVPFAERRSAFADERHGDATRAFAPERHRHARQRQRRDRERRRRQEDPPVDVAVAEVLSAGRWTRLRHLRVEHHTHGGRLRPHRQRDAQIANHRTDDVTVPRRSLG